MAASLGLVAVARRVGWSGPCRFGGNGPRRRVGRGRRPDWAGPGGLEGPRRTRRDRSQLADRHGHHHRGLRPARASSTASATSSSCSGPTASRRRTSARTSAASPPAPGASCSRPARRWLRASARSEARPNAWWVGWSGPCRFGGNGPCCRAGRGRRPGRAGPGGLGDRRQRSGVGVVLDAIGCSSPGRTGGVPVWRDRCPGVVMAGRVADKQKDPGMPVPGYCWPPRTRRAR